MILNRPAPTSSHEGRGSRALFCVGRFLGPGLRDQDSGTREGVRRALTTTAGIMVRKENKMIPTSEAQTQRLKLRGTPEARLGITRITPGSLSRITPGFTAPGFGIASTPVRKRSLRNHFGFRFRCLFVGTPASGPPWCGITHHAPVFRWRDAPLQRVRNRSRTPPPEVLMTLGGDLEGRCRYYDPTVIPRREQDTQMSRTRR